jgi:drug/metabolite transporter superfamily protein YnfA
VGLRDILTALSFARRVLVAGFRPDRYNVVGVVICAIALRFM